MGALAAPGYRGWVYQNAPATEALTFEIGVPVDDAGAVLPEYAAIDFTAVTDVTALVLLPGAHASVPWVFTVVSATKRTMVVSRVWQAGDTSLVGTAHFEHVTPNTGAGPLPEADPFAFGIRARP